MNLNLLILTLCQGLFLTNNVSFIAINGLVGYSMAPLGWMATLPVMGYVVGGAMSTGLVARSQTRLGRRRAFQSGAIVAMASTLSCAAAAWSQNFWLLCASTVVAGYFSANAILYRFAAAELARSDWKEKAVSLVMAGGLLGAVVGPNMAKLTRDLLPVPYLATYLSLTALGALSWTLLGLIRFPEVAPKPVGQAPDRTAMQLLRQPAFLVAAIAGALGYGVMNLLMAATPIAMQQCGYPFADAAWVLEWHVIGMFAPGFFTGHLIKRFGALPIMGLGVVLNLVCVVVALSGTEVAQFTVALGVLGLGWNFLFTASTTLAMTAYTESEKNLAQGVLNRVVFLTLAMTSFASGVLVTTQGWQLLNYGSLLPIAVTAAAIVWLMTRPRAGAAV